MKEQAISIVKTLQDNGFIAVFAGGFVRDMFLKRESKDIDIATSASPDEVEKLFKRTVPIGKAFGVINVLVDNFSFEVATFRTDGEYEDGRRPTSVAFASMEEDAKRRDLTINGMFYDPITKEVLDFVDGSTDISQKTIRFIGSPKERIEEDKLRMLRAIRFAAELGFNIDKYTLDVIRVFAPHITCISSERLREELTKMLKTNNPSKAFELMFETEILQFILPEIVRIKDCEQDPEWHPEGDVWNHTMILLDKLTQKTKDEALLWAGLLHDVGKPSTFNIVDGKIRASGHAKVGTDIAIKIMTRLKFSNDLIDRVDSMVYNHMKIKDVKKMNKSTLRKLMGREDIEDIKLLSFVDCLASSGDNEWHEFLEEKQKDFIKEEKPILPECFINGYDLIDMGFKPGPVIGKVLSIIMDLQLEEEISSKLDALVLAKTFLEKNNG
jgi:putative nucleotidyltransferase with HDIG domain